MNRLGLFAKFWEPGRVKTRLAADIGHDAACRIYEEFVRHLLKKLQDTADRRVLAYSPPEKQSEFAAAIGQRWEIRPQSAGDLGDRMAQFFFQFLAAGDEQSTADVEPTKVALIGTDCPHLSPATVGDAFASLDQHDLVLGPCPDGGYYLVGMKTACPGIFDDIQWSSEQVLEQTLARADELKLAVHLLPELIDIDHLADLRAVKQSVEASDCEADCQLFEKVDSILSEVGIHGGAP